MVQSRNLDRNLRVNTESKVNSVMETETISKSEICLKNHTSRGNLKTNHFMRKSFLILSLSFLLFSVKGQITLEHTFENYVSYGGGYYGGGLRENILPPIINYYVSANDVEQLKLYNEDYSLYKTIVITPPANHIFNSYDLFQQNVFTNDNKITFFVSFYDTINERYNLRIYDENKTLVKDFGYFAEYYYGLHYTSNNKWHLCILRVVTEDPITGYLTWETDIYSLPGTAAGVKSLQNKNTFSSPYPNPANATITLPYQLKQGETSVMRIYNTNGQLIETKQIDSMFDKILLNVSRYARGAYFYEVNGVSNKFIVK